MARVRQDEEEAARVRREQDELLQRDAETRQQILDLLAEAEKERDELLQTMGRLCSEHGVAHEERD